ncbi:unnamed protein product [Brassicogethes aeneus]|uniref:Uncharacterized protein n=1 Tax=Brassicogethes aeneus TaxID=1431903 RepID=A0A9P0FM57_BRAAE|nr:unnamed protein product [Brassicogethes aeneus]
MQRDLFGRLLGLSLEQKINIEKVLTYPLTPVPLSLCYINGNICKTDKSILMKCLEQKIQSEKPDRVDVVIIDGFFLMHLMKELPLSFGNIGKKNLQSLVKYNAETIAIVFDRYFKPSIKDYEHHLREQTNLRAFKITGPEQVRPSDFSKELKNKNFKEALVSFLIKFWSSDEATPIIGSKTVYLNYDMCYKYKVNNGKVTRSISEVFTCDKHEEADTKIVYHACKVDAASNILLRCSDTDILIIMLGNMEHLEASVKVWMEVGVGNAQRYVDVTKIYKSLGNTLCSALPGFHALTGCDFNPAFFRKGKKRPLSILKGSEMYQKSFIDLANLAQCETQQVIQNLEEFICHLYSIKKAKNVNEARFADFSTEKFFKPIVKSFDGSAVPPCQSELHQQILRASYISNIWRNAHFKYPTILSPVDNGWQEVDGQYEFKGDQLPTFVNEVVIQPEEGEDDNNSESDVSELEKSIDDIDDGYDKDDADNEYCEYNNSDDEEDIDEDEEEFI